MEHSPLKILIIGAGIGGLTAAIALRQQGHYVQVFEKSELAGAYGAAMHLSPNCTVILNRLGVYPEHIGGTSMRKSITYSSMREVISRVNFEETRKQWPAEYCLIHRVDLHDELKRKATEADDKSAPVQLHTGCSVSNIDCETATIMLADGRKISGDLVIAADGVHSKARNLMNGPSIQCFSTGKSCYRYLTPISNIRSDAATVAFVESPGTMIEFLGNDRRITIYPCSNNQSMYTGGFVPSSEVGPAEEGWDRAANKAKLLSSFSSFAPEIQKLVEKAPENDVKVWDLLDCPEVRTWTRGRTMLLGDAAHPFLPYMGQGGAMAIEDAASIAVLLPKGTSAGEVSGRLELFQQCRKQRVDHILKITRLRGRDPSGEEGPYPTGDEVAEFARYCINHNEWDHSTAVLNEHAKDSGKTGTFST